MSNAQAMTHLCDDILASFDQRRQAHAGRQEDVRSLRQDFARQGQVRQQARCGRQEDVHRFLTDTGAARDTMARGLRTELGQATKQRRREVNTGREERREAWEGQCDSLHQFLGDVSAARGAMGRQLREDLSRAPQDRRATVTQLRGDLSRATQDRRSTVTKTLNDLREERTEAERRWATLTQTMAQRRAGAGVPGSQ